MSSQQTSDEIFRIPTCNLGQGVGDKLTKLSKIGFSMECFTADFLQFFNKKRQNLAFGWMAGYSESNPSISGIFLKSPKSKVARQLVRQLVHLLSGEIIYFRFTYGEEKLC